MNESEVPLPEPWKWPELELGVEKPKCVGSREEGKRKEEEEEDMTSGSKTKKLFRCRDFPEQMECYEKIPYWGRKVQPWVGAHSTHYKHIYWACEGERSPLDAAMTPSGLSSDCHSCLMDVSEKSTDVMECSPESQVGGSRSHRAKRRWTLGMSGRQEESKDRPSLAIRRVCL